MITATEISGFSGFSGSLQAIETDLSGFGFGKKKKKRRAAPACPPCECPACPTESLEVLGNYFEDYSGFGKKSKILGGKKGILGLKIGKRTALIGAGVAAAGATAYYTGAGTKVIDLAKRVTGKGTGTEAAMALAKRLPKPEQVGLSLKPTAETIAKQEAVAIAAEQEAMAAEAAKVAEDEKPATNWLPVALIGGGALAYFLVNR